MSTFPATGADLQYLSDHNVHVIVEDMVSSLVQDKPSDPLDFMIRFLQKRNQCIEQGKKFEEKMKKEGLSSSFISSFLNNYYDLVHGKTGAIPDSSINPVASLPLLDSLSVTPKPSLLSETVVLKLNGGLGTGMGLEKAKSLLTVKGDDTFLDFIAKQVLHLRKQHNNKLKFMLMNSFSTSDDTKEFMKKYPELANEPDIELLQNKAPKVHADTLLPAEWPSSTENEWCPPGHGDLYSALYGSGSLDRLLSQGIKYMFVSNSDNLGATLDLKLLTYFAESGAPMLMEVCERTESDKKGGHLAQDKQGGLLLRESAQCPKEDEAKFQDITKYKFFNTNNLWLNLEQLKSKMESIGYLKLPLIRNAKTVDPRDPNSTKVFQLETAMGAAIASLPGAQAITVPRTRFAPVKTCSDLFVLRSDVYIVNNEYIPLLDVSRNEIPPVVDMDNNYKMVDQLEAAIKKGVPSLIKCNKLKVTGPVEFAPGVAIKGTVNIVNNSNDRKTVSGELSDTTVTL